MLNWPINKTKNNITKTLCSSPYLCCCFTADLKTWLAKFINRNRKRQTAKRARTAVFLVCFLQKAKANNKSVTLTLAPPASIIMSTKIPWTVMQCFLSNTSQLAITVSFAMHEPPLAYPVQKSHSRLNFQMKPLLRWTAFWFALVCW